jgi:peptidoglycan/xylan/chitin deacetylase (PgdA/CDA1 family)
VAAFLRHYVRVEEARRAELRRWAGSLAESSASADARAAARAIALLLEDIERLERELGSRRQPPPETGERPARSRRKRARKFRPGRGTSIGLLFVALALSGLLLAGQLLEPELAPAGPKQGDRIGLAAAGKLVFSVSADRATLAQLRWRVDGANVTAQARLVGNRSELSGSALSEGAHVVEAVISRWIPGATARRTWHIYVDRTPPQLAVDPASTKAPPGRPLTLRGTVEVDATLTADGVPAKVDDGTFSVLLPEAPAGPVELLATDAAGNRAAAKARITLVPRRPRAPLRSVHVTFYGWADPGLRSGVLRLVDEGRVNSVELDLKDESGAVGFDADIPFAKRIGSVERIYDLRQAIELLHRKGIWVVGRIVAFRDPVHAQAAWKRGWRSQVIQTPGGAPYSGYGGFTNFADPVVRQYNIDVARAAAELGIDDVLYDYVRRPDGPIGSMVFPGLAGTPEASIASFLGDARAQLRPYGVFLGASVFGVAATRPKEIAQPIRAIARNVDYVAPMLYPSHWGRGEYDVAYPNAQPYDIVFRSLEDFQKQTRGTGARVVPWLQDFTLGVYYRAAEVRAQIRAAAHRGIDEWLLWDPLVTYTADALDRHPPMPPIVKRPIERPPPKTQAAPGTEKAAAARRMRANELGVVPVFMYHQIRADGGGPYDLTPAQFRAELERFHREGYVPIRAADLAAGMIDVPAGKSPVVLTFDDSTKEQLAWDAQKRPKPNTAVGILLAFAQSHPAFEPAGTFYVNREPFAGVREGSEMLRWLHDNGFELGNHTFDHVPFSGLTPAQVQRELALGEKVITDAVPGAQVTTMSLPLGVVPKPASLARSGSWGGIDYRHLGVFLVGAEPAPSPFSTAFRPGAIPRIRTTPPGAPDPIFGSTFWLDELKRHPERRYVSDGDPDTIAFPQERAAELAPRFRPRARPY